MSMAMATPTTGAVRAADAAPDPLRAAAQDGEGEAVARFADALNGLAGALRGFAVAGALPVAGEAPAAEGDSAADPAADPAAAPALEAPLAQLTDLPAMAAATPAALALPAFAAAAEPDAGHGEPAPTAPVLVAPAQAGPAAGLQRLAEAAGPTPLPAAAPQGARAIPMAGAEALPAKLKAEVGADVPAEAAPEAPVADLAPSLAATPAREAAGGAGATATVKLPAAQPAQWRQPLMEALGERIQVEVGKQNEQAVIRLDPPMLGTVEIILRHQGGTLQVQLRASHDEVVRQLQQIGDSLRQDLARQQYTDVSVQVFAGSRDGDGRQRADGQPDERQPGRALADAEGDGEQPSAFVLSSHEH